MALPRATEARPYYRAAFQRWDDALYLMAGSRTTGAVYLAGYVIECMLKALIVDGLPASLREEVSRRFRGAAGHDLEGLLGIYRLHVNLTIPRDAARHLARVAPWSTNLRYSPGVIELRSAHDFFDSTFAIMAWADGRM